MKINKEFLNKNISLFLVFLIPFFFIFGVVLFSKLNLPSRNLTKYNFLYSYCPATPTDWGFDSDCDNDPKTMVEYYVNNNRLTLVSKNHRQTINPIEGKYTIPVFLYDTINNTKKELTLEEVASLTLVEKSPDNVSLVEKSNITPNVLFLQKEKNPYKNFYLKRGIKLKKIELIQPTENDFMNKNMYNSFQFIGWVLKD